MNVLVVYSSTSITTGTIITISPPPSLAYIGQRYYFVNVCTVASMLSWRTTAGITPFQGNQFAVGGQMGTTKNTAYTLTYIGQTNVGWLMVGM